MDDRSAHAPEGATTLSNGEPVEQHAPTLLGWSARLASVLLIAGLAGLVLYQTATEDEPIAFEIEVAKDTMRKQDGQWLIPLDITNTGSRTAQFIVLDVDAGGKKTEVEIDMLGSNEDRRVVVTADRPVAQVSHEIVKYESP